MGWRRLVTVRRHTLDIYGTEIQMATNRRDWATLRRQAPFAEAKPNSAGLACFAVFEPNDGSGITSHLAIWIDKAAHRSDLELIETCAHEAAHGVAQVFDWIGHEVKGSDEPSAYFVGWLTRWLCEGAM